ncbi:unnamed protein product [Clavelina lepadiformis]|uniref:EF-hand domain-containing protein n=1 Tax=Clavelina lepadiformis TaxID=159417 RepID=A0ABP0H6D6_CLALP
MMVFVGLFMVGITLAAVAKKDRVVDHTLSDKEPGSPDYDHDAFVGEEEAKKFNDLSPEESRRRLGLIVEKIDKDSNGKVTEKELEDWIIFTQQRYIHEDADKQFPALDKNGDGKIHWNEYKNTSYGYLSDEDLETSEKDDEFSYKQMIARDERRWDKADTNGDKHCDLDEFKAFLHPEEFPHMIDVVVQETMDDIDKNKDGLLSLEEYINDMHTRDDTEEEPEWVATEREQFTTYRDTDKDGYLNNEEVREWILPTDFNHAIAEAKHLIQEADGDGDGELTKDEIITHHDAFVGSQATDWGEALNRHDEF